MCLIRKLQQSIGYWSYGSQSYPIKWKSIFLSSGHFNTTIWRTTLTLTQCMEKKPDGNCTKMLWVVLNKSWMHHPIKQQLYDHLPPIMKTIHIRPTRHPRRCWRSMDELISDVLQWTPSHRRVRVGQPVWTYLWQLYIDTGCSMEDLPGAMDNRNVWRERMREIHAGEVWTNS